MLGEGGVGHLWSQVLGDWVEDLFDGTGHHSLRTKAGGLFTEAAARDLVAPAAAPVTSLMTQRLTARDDAVDVADLARVLVGRIVVAMLRHRLDGFHALRPTAPVSTTRTAGAPTGSSSHRRGGRARPRHAGRHGPVPETVDRARQILDGLTGGVPRAYRTAPESTVLGRCRALGVTEQEATGLASLPSLPAPRRQRVRSPAPRPWSPTRARPRGWPARRGATATTCVEAAVREGLRVTTPAPGHRPPHTRDVSVGGRTLRAARRVLIPTYRSLVVRRAA